MQLSLGSAASFDALVYGEANPSTVSFLQNQYENVSRLLTDAGRNFMDRGRSAFEHFNSSAAMQFARNAIRAVHGDAGVTRIGALTTIAELQGANLLMQRWIMANPAIREKYLKQQMDGYSDTYHNVHGSVVGENHYDYRRAVDGLVEDTENDGWVCVQYCEPLVEGDRDLSLDEQMDIRRSWRASEMITAMGNDDVTNNSGGSL